MRLLGRARAVRVSAVSAAAATAAALLGVAASAAANAPALVAQWRFDEFDGQVAVDDGPHRLEGRLGGTDAPEADDPVRIGGATGHALRFTGASFVRLPDTDLLAPPSLTAEAVVRAPASPGQWRYIISRGGQGCTAGAYGIYTAATGGLAIYVFDGTRYIVSATARAQDVWNGTWHHVAGTFDGHALRLFLDGRPVGEPIPAPLVIDYASTSAHAAVGQYAGSCQLSFQGDVDLVRLWSGAQSPDALTAAAHAAAPASTNDAAPLPAAAPGTVLQGAPSPARPNRSCRVRVLRPLPARKRHAVVRVRVTAARGRPIPATRLIARQHERSRILAKARTNATGRARLALRAPRPPRVVRISAPQHPNCNTAKIRLRPT